MCHEKNEGGKKQECTSQQRNLYLHLLYFHPALFSEVLMIPYLLLSSQQPCEVGWEWLLQSHPISFIDEWDFRSKPPESQPDTTLASVFTSTSAFVFRPFELLLISLNIHMKLLAPLSCLFHHPEWGSCLVWVCMHVDNICFTTDQCCYANLRNGGFEASFILQLHCMNGYAKVQWIGRV